MPRYNIYLTNGDNGNKIDNMSLIRADPEEALEDAEAIWERRFPELDYSSIEVVPVT